MAWKQDLAKLKQQLEPEPSVPAPRPAPRAPTTPPPPLEDEDAVFLSAMGLKPKGPRRSLPEVAPQAQPQPATTPDPVPETFEAALKDLKGLKPLGKALPGAPSGRPQPVPPEDRGPSAPPVVPLVPTPVPVEIPAPPAQATPLQDPEPPAPLLLPLRFQLAAGMAIEVDGTLDLRGHSLADAMDRLQDRLGDGHVLGWRSLLVTLGPDPTLHEGLLTLLASGQVPMVARFAQAPVPMGGNQAWLLYFGPSPNPS